MCRPNGWLTKFWVVMIPFSIATGWVRSVNVRVGADIAGDVVEAVARQTEVQRA